MIYELEDKCKSYANIIIIIISVTEIFLSVYERQKERHFAARAQYYYYDDGNIRNPKHAR